MWFAEVLTQVTARACNTGTRLSTAHLPLSLVWLLTPHDSSMVEALSVSTTHLESCCSSLSILLPTSIRNQDVVLEPGLGFRQSHVRRNDTIKLILTWEAVKVMITGLSFSHHCFISTGGALTAAFFCGKQTDPNRKFHASVLILETILFQGKTASNLQSLNSKPSSPPYFSTLHLSFFLCPQTMHPK